MKVVTGTAQSYGAPVAAETKASIDITLTVEESGHWVELTMQGGVKHLDSVKARLVVEGLRMKRG